MSYGSAAALQTALYQRLTTDTEVVAAVGAAVFDMVPTGPLPPLYIVLGRDEQRDASDYTGAGAWHEAVISVVAESASFLAAKEAARAVSDALVDAPLSLSRGTLVSLRLMRALARQTENGTGRRIDLRFRARIDDTD